MNRDDYDKGEQLIADLTANIGPNDEYRDAIYAYLLKAAQGEPPREDTQRRVMAFLALALEGVAPSVQLSKDRRRNFCADVAFLSQRLWQQQRTNEGLESVSAEFDVSFDALRKRAKRNGLLDAELEMKVEEQYASPKSKGEIEK